MPCAEVTLSPAELKQGTSALLFRLTADRLPCVSVHTDSVSLFKIYLFKKEKKIKGSMAINNFKKVMKTIVNMKCIVMVIFSYTL